MNRIDALFNDCREKDRRALIMYVCAGDPDLKTTADLIRGIVAAGADLVEVGVPFSDPMADGPTIQAAGERALAAGTTLPAILDMVRDLRCALDTPMVLFSYYNVLFNYGIEAIAEQAAEAGIDGVLIVDVPFEEMHEVRPALNAHGLYLISLVAPTTDSRRARTILADAQGFVYCITVTGVTGARSALPEELGNQLDSVRTLSPVPVAAGFGISGPEMARATAEHADGVVVGSALVNRLAEAQTPEQGIDDCTAFVRELADALRTRPTP